MGMVIHDDFWAACQAMPEKQRAPFLYALAEYRFEKKEPKGSPPWLPTFIAFKQRIDLSDEASAKGRKMAEARWGKKRAASDGRDAAATHGHDARADAQAYARAYAAASESFDAEKEKEIGVDIPPYSPPAISIEDAPFWMRCLAAFNDARGTAYTTMPEKCRRTLERAEGSYTVEQVGAMVSYKCDQLAKTRWKGCRTPSFLFSPDHFEECMHQSIEAREEADRYADYA